MNRSLAWVLASAAVWVLGGCDEDSTASVPPTLTRAEAPSTHYVRLTLSGPPTDAHLVASRYRIVGPDGAPLAVREARAAAGHVVVLATEAQRPVTYRLSFPADAQALPPIDGAAAHGTAQHALHAGVDFEGSTLGEAHLVGATAVDNTHVILAFSDRLHGGAPDAPDLYSIDAPNLEVLGAELSDDASAVLLTTSPQEAVAYTVRVHGLYAHARSGVLLDPFRSDATFEGRLSRDDAAPALLGAVALSNARVLLTFSEALAPDATDLRHFAVDPALTVTGASLQSQDAQILLETTPMSAGVTYTVTVDGVRDRALNPMPPATATFASPGLTDGDSEPTLLGALSTGNTGVLVRYSKPMDDHAVDPGRYVIVQENENTEAAYVGVLDAAFTDDRRVAVQLTTLSQNDVTYRISAVDVADRAGNPLKSPFISHGVLVDPTSAVFAGTPPSGRDGSLVDSDGDGLTDNRELRGWQVAVRRLDGTVHVREVTSDPGDPRLPPDHPINVAARDTDLDGLDDAIEHLLGSDPRAADTDGDILTDDEEYNAVFTDQNAVDTDEDGFDDLLEVAFYKTNALMADSDGDGFTDREELLERGRDPRVADVPAYRIEVGTVRLHIDERFSFTNEEGESVTEADSSAVVLATGNSRSVVRLRGDVRTTGGGTEFGVDACQSDCDKLSAAQFFNRIFATGHVESSTETLDLTDIESAREAESVFERSVEKGRELSNGAAVTREVDGASVLVEVTLSNPSSVAISLSNVTLTLQTTDPQDPTRRVVVATLLPERTLITGEPTTFNIAPGEATGPIAFANDRVFPSVVEDLLRAPRGLVTRVAHVDLSTADGRNFAFGLETVRERTVGLVIDDGTGVVQQLRAIAAGVLDRPKDDLRCAPTGDHPGAACADDADCGTSTPCRGGQVVGGFAGYTGTGPVRGIPLDFLLQDTLGLRRTRPQTLVAGADGVADSVAHGDDVQVIAPGTAGLAPDAVVVAAGRDLRLETQALGDDANLTAPDGIVAGPDGTADSIAAGDDVQRVPVGTRGVPDDTVIIGAGENGVLDTVVRGDDAADVVTGYEVSLTCDAETPFRILAGPNGAVETTAVNGTCIRAFAPHFRGEACAADADCGADADSDATGVCAADVQTIGAGQAAASDAVVVAPGGSGYLFTVPQGDDLFLGPGVPCTHDSDCRAEGLVAGRCAGTQKVVRVGSRRDGQFQRFWTLLLPDNVQFQTDFALIQVRPGDVIGLKFVQDVDRDGLIAEEELLAGSSDFARDTDADTLDDYAEVRVGWTIGVEGAPLRRVFPNPRSADSDGDGLFDHEELDLRPLRCACDATGPSSVVGRTGEPCATDATCGGGVCRDASACSVAGWLAGDACPRCAVDPSGSRTDPRRADTDGDAVSDFDEVFGYLVGAGVADATFAEVVLAGDDHTADTLACPQNHCAGGDQHCHTDGDCANRQCVRPVPCDDVQVVPRGSGGWDARTVVVAPGLIYDAAEGLTLIDDVPADGDVLLIGGDAEGASHALGDDVPFVGAGEAAFEGAIGALTCVDGSRVQGDVARRFPFCGLIKPGPDGALQSDPGGDDVLVPAGRGQLRVTTDPLRPDTDRDELLDGVERLAGSSPTDPSDTGQAGDLDGDGLTDLQEAGGWTVGLVIDGVAMARRVASNAHVADTDLDGLPDYAERNMPCNDAPGAICPTDPNSADSDGDGINDHDELSAAKFDQLEALNGFFPNYHVDRGDSALLGTNPVSTDTDGDGISDFDELYRPFTVTLRDGRPREVLTDPTAADTDGDGASDAEERDRVGGATDPTDADTDDDDKLDGFEMFAVPPSDPLTPDIRVTVTFRRIEIDDVEDSSNNDNTDIAWWFMARAPSLQTNPTLVSSPAVFAADDDDGNADGHEVAQLTNDHDDCHLVHLQSHRRHQLFLDQSITFTLSEGESFVLEGMLAELDNSGDGSTTRDCGAAPNYVPRRIRSACFSRFNDTYGFADLVQEERGEVRELTPIDGRAEGGDTCIWRVVGAITVE